MSLQYTTTKENAEFKKGDFNSTKVRVLMTYCYQPVQVEDTPPSTWDEAAWCRGQAYVQGAEERVDSCVDSQQIFTPCNHP